METPSNKNIRISSPTNNLMLNSSYHHLEKQVNTQLDTTNANAVAANLEAAIVERKAFIASNALKSKLQKFSMVQETTPTTTSDTVVTPELNSSEEQQPILKNKREDENKSVSSLSPSITQENLQKKQLPQMRSLKTRVFLPVSNLSDFTISLDFANLSASLNTLH